mgnify:CR=1 FL=1
MLDAFKNKIKIGDVVLYSPSKRDTEYNVGNIIKFHPGKQTTTKNITYFLPDRVEIKVFKSSSKYVPTKNVIVYASNVVKKIWK